MSSRLETLIEELFALIMTYLPRRSVGRLRVTSQTMHDRLTGPTFRKRFRRLNVEMSIRGLRDFITITRGGTPENPRLGLGRHVRLCTLTGVVRNRTGFEVHRHPDRDLYYLADPNLSKKLEIDLDKEPEEDPAEHIRLLTEAFTNLRRPATAWVPGVAQSEDGVEKKTRAEDQDVADNVTEDGTDGQGTLGYLEGIRLRVYPRPVEAVAADWPGYHTRDLEWHAFINWGHPHYGPDGQLLAPLGAFSWRSTWEATARTFASAMAALEASELAVTNQLDLFGNQRSCSLAHRIFTDYVADAAARAAERAAKGEPAVKHPFRKVKCLTLSLSRPCPSAAEELIANRATKGALPHNPLELRIFNMYRIKKNAMAQKQDNCIISERLLRATFMRDLPQIMPMLSEIDLHWFRMAQYRLPKTPEPAAEGLDEPLPAGAPSLALRKLTLRGVDLSGPDLVTFLDGTGARYVKLQFVDVVKGTCEPVLRCLTNPEGPVEYFHLDDLQEGARLVHYDAPGQPKFDYQPLPGVSMGHIHAGPSEVKRSGSRAKQPLEMHLVDGMPRRGSPALMRWQSQIHASYSNLVAVEKVNAPHKFGAKRGHRADRPGS